jgi:hypothetical protein
MHDTGLVNPIDTATAGIWLNQVPDLSRLSGLTQVNNFLDFSLIFNALGYHLKDEMRGWPCTYSNANHQLRQLGCRSPVFTLASSIFVSYSQPPFAASRSSLPLYLTALPYTRPITLEFVNAPPTMTPSSFS